MGYSTLASTNSIDKTRKALEKRGYEVFIVKDKIEALRKIKDIIPKGVSVMNGSSVTLEQIGYLDYLSSGKHKWDNLGGKIKAEPDKEKRRAMRKQSVLSDFYLGSVHALTENGEFLVASNTGSQLPHVVYTSPNLIFIVSTKKIVTNFEEAMGRIEKHVYPLEGKHMRELYNQETAINKIVIFRGEAPMIDRRVTFILVKENLGY